MTNEIAIGGVGEIELTADQLSQLIAAEMRADESAHAYKFIPTRIAMPSGKPPYQFSDGETNFSEFSAVIAVGQMARAYFPSKDALGLPPVCSSNDGIVGRLTENISPGQKQAAMEQIVVHPGLRFGSNKPIACRDCPLAQWGSGANGGQACKDLRRLLLLVDGWSMPVILTLPPTSIKNFDKFSSTRSMKKQGYFTCLVKFGLTDGSSKRGAKYPVVTIAKIDELDTMQQITVLNLRKQFAELVRTIEIDASDYSFSDDAQEDTPF